MSLGEVNHALGEQGKREGVPQTFQETQRQHEGVSGDGNEAVLLVYRRNGVSEHLERIVDVWVVVVLKPESPRIHSRGVVLNGLQVPELIELLGELQLLHGSDLVEADQILRLLRGEPLAVPRLQAEADCRGQGARVNGNAQKEVGSLLVVQEAPHEDAKLGLQAAERVSARRNGPRPRPCRVLLELLRVVVLALRGWRAGRLCRVRVWQDRKLADQVHHHLCLLCHEVLELQHVHVDQFRGVLLRLLVARVGLQAGDDPSQGIPLRLDLAVDVEHLLEYLEVKLLLLRHRGSRGGQRGVRVVNLAVQEGQELIDDGLQVDGVPPELVSALPGGRHGRGALGGEDYGRVRDLLQLLDVLGDHQGSVVDRRVHLARGGCEVKPRIHRRLAGNPAAGGAVGPPSSSRAPASRPGVRLLPPLVVPRPPHILEPLLHLLVRNLAVLLLEMLPVLVPDADPLLPDGDRGRPPILLRVPLLQDRPLVLEEPEPILAAMPLLGLLRRRRQRLLSCCCCRRCRRRSSSSCKPTEI
mmetsp:Transcript_7257/g.13368  ORF Transcript_7257/g.13368 Transcript_7257/m.13368 type:complete len:527 (-) Transcript_7257:330-1910(-)